MNSLFIYIAVLFGFQDNDSINTAKYLEYYNKAKTSYFYSLGRLNSYYELELTKEFLDSASIYLKGVDEERFPLFSEQYNTLKDQVRSSNVIALDNINYIIPSFSSLADYRDDFNNIDDAQELLIEGLIDNIINQSEPTIKGSIKENQQYLISNISPYDEILLGVVNDYINSNSNLYHIQNHEIIEIIGKEGFNRFKNNELTFDDFKRILKNYEIDKIYNISIVNKPTPIDKLFYSGIDFKVIRSNSTELFPVRYFETFRIDKAKDFRNSFLISASLLMIIFIIVFFGYNNLSDNFRSFNKENFISDSLIIFGLISSLFLSVFILRLIKPELNAFIGEIYTKLWITLSLIIPMAITFVVSTLLHTRFSKNSSTDLRALRKFIFVSISAPIIIFNHFSYYSQIVTKLNWVLVSLVLLVCYAFLARYLAIIIRNARSIKFSAVNSFFLASIICCLVAINFMYVFEDINLTYLGISLVPLSIFGLNSIRHKQFDNENYLLTIDETNGLEAPYEYISQGFNINEVKSKLDSFISTPHDLVFFIDGSSNIGKTRFLREYTNEGSGRLEFFYGDFNEYKEGGLQTYEPFYEAFCLHDNQEFRLDKNFFNDRSKTFKTLKKVADIAMSSAPIDLGEIISIDDSQKLSLEEISRDLINTLLEFSKTKSIIIILDDYQWVDEETNALLIELIKGLKNRGKIAKNIKIILSISDVETQLANNSSFKLLYDQLKEVISDRFDSTKIECVNSQMFFNHLFRKEGFRFFKDRPNLKFSESFKIHLRKVIKQNNDVIVPGYFFNYISILEKENLVSLDHQLIHLTKEPPQSISYQDSVNLILKSKYEKLDFETKQILESAAHIGYKFDASILSNIWKKDIIKIIQLLESVEELGLIKDESNYDNIYSFENKNFHKWLRSNHKGINDRDYRQKIIEIQKRIISSVVDKGELYVKSLDVDILKSLSYRCKMFEHVQEIMIHTLKFNLLTALKLVQENKSEQAVHYLLNIKEHLGDFKKSDVDIVLDIFENYLNESIGLQLLDIELIINGLTHNLLNVLFETLIRTSNKVQRSKSVLCILQDTYQRELYYISSTAVESLTRNEQFILNRINSLNNYRNFVLKNDELEADFYVSIIEDRNNPMPLLGYRKSAINNENFELAFNINMELINIFKAKENIEEMFIVCQESLLMINSEEKQLHFSNEVLDFGKVKMIVREILSNTNISLKMVKKLSRVASKYIEAYFLKEEFQNVVELTALVQSLIIRSRNDKVIKSIWPICGASYYNLGEIEKAESVYFNHFDLLIEQGAPKEDFMHPIDGIIHCCRAKNDFTNYEKIRKDLYEHMLYMSDKMMNTEFVDSKISSKKPLSQILSKRKINNISNSENVEFSHEVFKILYVIAKSDGEVDKAEIYDIIESVNAVNISLGYNFYSNYKTFENVISKLNNLEPQELFEFISKEIDKLADRYDKNTLKSLYHLCVDISKADGIIAIEEQKILDLLRDKIII